MAQARPWLKVGVRLDFEQHRPLKALYEDTAPEIIICKASQVGASEFAISWILHQVDECQVNALYAMPTDDDASDFSAARLNPALEANVSPYLAGRVVRGGARGADRVTLKRIGDRFLYLRGAKVKADNKAAQLKSMDAGALVLDELDEMDVRAPAIALERLGATLTGQQLQISTPTYSGVGIDATYATSDQRRWHIKCAHCNEWQSPGLESLVLAWDKLKRPTAWHGGDEPYLACRKCGKPLDRLGPGEWVAAFPSREAHGYFLSGFFFAAKKLTAILGSRELNKGLLSTNDTTRKEVYNQKLGLVYEPSSESRFTDAFLDSCKRDYGHGPRAGGAFMGVDIGKLLHIVIRAPDWTQLYAGTRSDFTELDPLIKSYGVLCTVIDLEPETKLARAFQAQRPRESVWLADYVTGREKHDVDAFKADDVDRVIKADRTRTLDASRALFVAASEGRAGATLPANARDIPDYYDHLKALERVLTEDADGNPVARFIQHGADHYAHAENYAYLAASRWMQFISNQQGVVYDPVKIGNW